MIMETMTRRQRLQAALNLEMPDRTPVAPLIDFKFPCRHYGVSQAEGITDRDLAAKLMRDLSDELGGIDATVIPGVGWLSEWTAAQAPMPLKRPGKELNDEAMYQFDEKEVMSAEDYDRLLEVGWKQLSIEILARNTGQTAAQIDANREKWIQQGIRDIQAWENKGIPVMVGATVFTPLMALSCSRTMIEFTKDLYRQPDKVAAAMDSMVADLIDAAIYMTERTGIPGALVILERGSGFYYPLRLFQQFELPYLKMMVDAFVSRGMTPILHFDTNWILNLPYVKEALPRRKCICELDSTTPIFEAKEILRDHMCIMGDVPASLLAVGTPQQVENYAKKLIEVVGGDGGFILSTGCVCPIDARFENFKAMVDTAKNYAPGVHSH